MRSGCAGTSCTEGHRDANRGQDDGPYGFAHECIADFMIPSALFAIRISRIHKEKQPRARAAEIAAIRSLFSGIFAGNGCHEVTQIKGHAANIFDLHVFVLHNPANESAGS